MTGWILYSKADVEKNRIYIQMYKDKFQQYNIKIETVIIEDEGFVGNCKSSKEFADKIEVLRPDFAINRSRDFQIAGQLELAGVKVFNTSIVTKIANNKGTTYDFLKGVVPFMPVIYNDKKIVSHIENAGLRYPYVIKSCAGHGGGQVFLVNNIEEEQQAVEKVEGEEYVIQSCCSDLGKDVRVYIIGNKIVAAILRTSGNSFKSNYSLGGKAQTYNLSSEEVNMVNSIIEKLPLDYAGIDFIFHKGRAVFNEIEDAVGARMLYASSKIDIVQTFVDYIAEKIGKR